MSRVFVAYDQSLGRQVVVKVLSAELAADVSAERFRREIRLAAQLQHPHIVPLLTAGEVPAANGDTPLPYYTMPLAAGESLRARLARGELPVADAVRILRDIADALAFAHERGVVHRDVKPENVLLTGDHALVIDFGVAKAVHDAAIDTETPAAVDLILGTPAYMAPEQAGADPLTDHRADIYAFGIVAYEMLTGRPPFDGRSARQVIAAHATEQPTPIEQLRPSVPPALAALVTQCVEKRPADRPQSARELLRVLESLATPSGDAHAATPVMTRRWVSWRVAGLAAGVVLVTALAVFEWQRLSRPALSPHLVAVAPFENLTNDTSLAQVGRIAADWITEGAVQVESVTVVPSSTVSAALTGAATSGSGDVVQRLARATHAGVVITGDFVRSGDSLRFSATAIDARKDKPIRVIGPVAGPVSDPLVAISALRERLLGSLASGEETRGVALAGDPPKYEAYRTMMDGWDRFLRVDYGGALPALRRALELDSNYVLAHIALALAYGNLGRPDSAERVIADVDRLQARMSVADKLRVNAFKAMMSGDAEAEHRFETEYIERDSEPLWVFQAGFSALKLMRAHEAEGLFLSVDSILLARGWAPQIYMLSNVFHAQGEYGKQLSTLERGRRMFPAYRLYIGFELTAFAGLRRAAQALALADTALAGADAAKAAKMAPLGWLDAAAYEFRAHGDAATGRLLARKVISWDAVHPGPPVHARELAVGIAWMALGNLDSASARYQLAARDSSTLQIVGFNAFAAALKGDTARALAVADSLAAVNAPHTTGARDFWRAAILGQLGDREQAVELLNQSVHEGQQQIYLWHSDGVLRALHGYPPFERLIAAK